MVRAGNSSDRRRVHVRYEGHVQGVGFRFTACRIAGDHGVDGWVRNQPDGSVELVGEGSESDLQAFLEALRQSPVGRFIIHEFPEWTEARGQFRRFDIAY